jgi:hypothetical protein
MIAMHHLEIQPGGKPTTRDLPTGKEFSDANLQAAKVNLHPTSSGDENASIFFVGTATTILLAGLMMFRMWNRC